MHRPRFLLILLLVALVHGSAWAQVPPADALLDQVLQSFPTNPVTVSGNLIVRRRRGVPIETYAFDMTADWQAAAPRVSYTIYAAAGEPLSCMQFSPGAPQAFVYRTGADLTPAPLPELSGNIAKTDISWSDITLQFLWWRGARRIGRDTVRGFECHVLQVSAPPRFPSSYASVKLWIGMENGLLLQAVGLDAQGEPLRKLWVQSVRRIAEQQWMLSTLEVQQSGRNSRTRLEIGDVSLHER